jgi:hypothetical protein
VDRQLRLGLGQVPHYATALRLRGEDVVPLLLTSSGTPTDLCAAVFSATSVGWLLAGAADEQVDAESLTAALGAD